MSNNRCVCKQAKGYTNSCLFYIIVYSTIMNQDIINPSTSKPTGLKPGYNPSLGPIQLPSSYQSQIVSKSKNIYDNSVFRRTPEVNLSSLAFLFSAIIQETQQNSKGVQQLEAKLNSYGYGVGTKFLELITLRDGKSAKRETKIVEVLQFIHTQVWKTLFGRPADGLEKSQDSEDECM